MSIEQDSRLTLSSLNSTLQLAILLYIGPQCGNVYVVNMCLWSSYYITSKPVKHGLSFYWRQMWAGVYWKLYYKRKESDILLKDQVTPFSWNDM